MKGRVYRFITSFSEDQTASGIENLSESERERVLEIADNEYIVDFKYDDEVCHWRKGHLNLSILIVTEELIEEIKNFDKIIHEDMEGFSIVDDITEDVLYDIFDTSVFGFLEFEMRHDFFKYREANLTVDTVLDKIIKCGKDSLTENEKLFLAGKPMISPLDEIEDQL